MVKRIQFSILFLLVFLIQLSFSGTIQLPRTGQTKCYDSVGTEIPCAGTGQDGEIQAGIEWPDPRFIITYCDANGPCSNQSSDCDGNSSTDVVTNNLTGLMWARNGNLPNSTMTWQQGIDYANNLNLCSYSDWRLPNVNELESLINADEPDTAAWLNTQGFNNVLSDLYGSSTAYAVSPDNIWFVSMKYGSVNYGGGYCVVWPVRAGQSGSPDPLYPANIWATGQTTSYATGDDGDLERGVAWPYPRFSDLGNGTVADNLTGLNWTKDANAPGPSVCTPGTYKLWLGALDYVACLNDNSYLGYNDWRLPNRKELRSLIDYSNYAPPLPSGHPFINVGLYYYYHWSSTTVANATFTYDAYSVGMWGGDVRYDSCKYCGDGLRVWPVRGGVFNPDISVTPTPYDFGSVNVGSSSSPQTFTISNSGTADLHILDMTLSDTTNYSLNINGGSNPCGSTTPTIIPNSSCTVTVAFSPSSTGQKDANLTISSDDPDTPTLNVSLSGTGIIPSVECRLVPDATSIYRGGTLGFWASAQNNEGTTQNFKFVTKVKLPNGNMYPSSGWLFGPISVTLGPHTSKSKYLTQFIPGNAPYGTYTYYGYVGTSGPPVVKYNECQFTFTVTTQGQGCTLCHQ